MTDYRGVGQGTTWWHQSSRQKPRKETVDDGVLRVTQQGENVALQVAGTRHGMRQERSAKDR